MDGDGDPHLEEIHSLIHSDPPDAIFLSAYKLPNQWSESVVRG